MWSEIAFGASIDVCNIIRPKNEVSSRVVCILVSCMAKVVKGLPAESLVYMDTKSVEDEDTALALCRKCVLLFPRAAPHVQIVDESLYKGTILRTGV